MSAPEDRQAPHEIVIVRRRSGGHGDGHHGGAWKIAFADFMTALMCFFLVMWLINASDKKTITQIATYFNPLRLNERISSQKGLDDETAPPTEAGQEKGKRKSPPSEPKSEKGEKKEKREKESSVDDKSTRLAQAERMLAAELDLLRDPYGVLEKIVASDPNLARAASPAAEAGSRLPKDLFDPQGAGSGDASSDAPRSAIDRQKASPQAVPAAKSSPLRLADVQGRLDADKLKSEIAGAIARLETPFKPIVEITDEGREILISITDHVEQGMYAIGSSRPTPTLVHVMEVVGRALAGRAGIVVVRGHTDARPYAAGPFDNWRLSSARAQVAYHMLVRGGLASERVQRIEGHADRRLKVPSDPFAPANRRIEILVGKDR
jgi:chemotaxis protein MotB